MAITSKSIALTTIFLSLLFSCASSQQETKFLNHGFLGANLLKFGSSIVHPSGLLELTNTSMRQIGQAFHGFPIPFSNPNSWIRLLSPQVLSLPSLQDQLHLATVCLSSFHHVGIDLNGVVSVESAPAAYFDDLDAKNISLKLASGDPIRVWIEYNATEMMLNVTLAPLERPKPNIPLLSRRMNLSGVLSEKHYVGFSAATGTITSTHLVLGWSFSIEGKATEIDLTKLPSILNPPSPSSLPPNPPVSVKKDSNNTKLIIIFAVSATGVIMILVLLGFWIFRRKQVFFTGSARKFSHQMISNATGGFDKLWKFLQRAAYCDRDYRSEEDYLHHKATKDNPNSRDSFYLKAKTKKPS